MKLEMTFVILAGGKSSRIGRNKADLLINNQTFLEILIDKANQLNFPEILISSYSGNLLGHKNILDLLSNRGPLGGLYSCFLAASYPHCFVLSVDVPLIEKTTIQNLIDFHFSHPGKASLLKHGDRIEPLIGIYDSDTVPILYKVIEQGAAPVFRFLDQIPYQIYHFSGDSRTLSNINTLEIYEQIAKISK